MTDGARPMIEVTELVSGYDERAVLRGLSLEVGRGEILVVMGQSGCGKTTFLRHLMGLTKPWRGTIRIGALEMTTITPEEYFEFCRSVGVLFQSGALFNSITVGENVAFPLQEHSELDKAAIRECVEKKLEQVGLADTSHLMPSQLSGGMRKRAGLARALVMEPEILLLDEPTTGLDPIIAAGIDELVLRIRDETGATIVVVAHDVAGGLKVADRLAMFHEGRVMQLGTPDEIRHSPHDYIQRFIGRQADPSIV